MEMQRAPSPGWAGESHLEISDSIVASAGHSGFRTCARSAYDSEIPFCSPVRAKCGCPARLGRKGWNFSTLGPTKQKRVRTRHSPARSRVELPIVFAKEIRREKVVVAVVKRLNGGNEIF